VSGDTSLKSGDVPINALGQIQKYEYLNGKKK
jgi:hypothetical protein